MRRSEPTDPPGVEFVGVPPPEEPHRPGRRPPAWMVVAGIALVALVVWAVSLGADDLPVPPEAAVDGDPATFPIELSPEARAALGGRVERVVFVATSPAPAGGQPVHQLWRLDVSQQRVVMGALVPPTMDLRAVLDGGAVGLAADGSLYLVHSIPGGQPQDIRREAPRFDREAEAFDVDEDTGSLVFASVDRTERAGILLSVSVRESVEARDQEISRATVRDFSPLGIVVLGFRVLAWGEDGDGTTVVLDRAPLGSTERHEHGTLSVLGVGPGGQLLVSAVTGRGHAPGLLAPGPGETPDPVAPGLRLGTAAAWAPDESVLAAIGTGPFPGALEDIQIRGLWLVPADGSPARLVRRGLEGLLDRSVTFSPDGELLLWAEPGVIVIHEVDTGTEHRIELPPEVPLPTGPAAAS